MHDRPLVFLDLETTGATAAHDRITEIGLIEVEHGRVLGEWSTLINPERRIPPFIESLTGISNDMVALAPTFAEVARGLRSRLDGKLLVAHNARFDYGFLKNEFQRLDIKYRSDLLCTVRLSRRLFPGHARHNLDSLMQRHGITCSARHRALGDARVLWRLLQRWQRELDPVTVAAAATELVKAPTVPAGLPANAFDDIPEAPGVYLFYGENGVALYVEKSINLRARVMSHFSGDHRVNKDMKIAREVARIDWIETAGELGALIEEARLVKRLAPVHNRRLRRAAELCSWHWRIEPWPFRGRVGVREVAPDGEKSELIVLDRWCYLGTVRSEHELHELQESRPQPVFDLDTYKILTRFFKKPHRACSIVELAA